MKRRNRKKITNGDRQVWKKISLGGAEGGVKLLAAGIALKGKRREKERTKSKARNPKAP